MLSWCKIDATNICRGKKRSFYLNSAKSRNEMSKGKLEWEATRKNGLLYGCMAVALALHLSCVSHMEWSLAILRLNISGLQGMFVEWINNFCCCKKKRSLLNMDVRFRYINCMSFIYLPRVWHNKHQLFHLFMECLQVTHMSWRQCCWLSSLILGPWKIRLFCIICLMHTILHSTWALSKCPKDMCSVCTFV